jgi:hypothetical protein
MKKLVLCLILLFMSMPLFAVGTSIGFGSYGGIELLNRLEDASETDYGLYPSVGGLIDFSLPGIPLSFRADFEVFWKIETETYDYEDYTTTEIYILIPLTAQFNIALSKEIPISIYIGGGLQLAFEGVSFSYYDYYYDDEYYEDYYNTAFGLRGYVGTSFNMNILSLFAEAGFGMIFAEKETVEVKWHNLVHIPIRAGIKINLPI